MNGNLFIDTNIAIYLLGHNEQVVTMLDEQTIYLSFVTELELLSKPSITVEEEQTIRTLLTQCVVVDFLPLVKETVVTFRRQYRLKLPDAIVAATAYTMGLPQIVASAGLTN